MELILNWILETLSQLNIYIFSLLAPFLEELIAPIPSPVIFGTLGSIAYLKKLSLLTLALLNLLGSASKTLASVIIYMIVYKFQYFLSGHFGRLLGWNHKSIDKFGENFGKGLKGFSLLLFLRSIPVVPSTLVSLAGGFFHVPIGNYIVATLVGSYIRNGILIAIGYLGIENIEAWQQGIHSIESSLGFIFLLAALVGFYLWRYLKSRRAAK